MSQLGACVHMNAKPTNAFPARSRSYHFLILLRTPSPQFTIRSDAATMACTDQLVSLLQGLPAELFNEIFEYTFTPTTSQVAITTAYRPPLELQISTLSREKFARRYYGSTKFIAGDMTVLVHWLRHLRVKHIERLADVRYLVAPPHARTGNDIVPMRHMPAISALIALGQLSELVFSADIDWRSELRWTNCNFLRVQDMKIGALSESVAVLAPPRGEVKFVPVA